MYWLLMLLSTGFELFGDFLFKKNQLVTGMALYATGTLFWAVLLKDNELSKSIVTFTVVNMIAACLIGILFLQEQLSMRQTIGVVLAGIAVCLVES